MRLQLLYLNMRDDEITCDCRKFQKEKTLKVKRCGWLMKDEIYDAKISCLLKDPGIIRNRLKVQAAKINARAYLRVGKGFRSFDKFIWLFVNGKPMQNSWKSLSEIAPTTKELDAMSKEFKRKGFKFVGSTICYAFMRVVGMVNAHTIDCYRHRQIKQKK